MLRRPRSTKSRKTEKKNSDWWARALSIFSIALAVGGMYLTNFYRPESLVVNARVVEQAKVGSGSVDVSILFTNASKQAVAIENVFLSLNYGPTARVENSADALLDRAIATREIGPILDGERKGLSDGSAVVTYRPKDVSLNNQTLLSSTALIDANTAALMILHFETDPIDLGKEGPVVPMIAVNFYDKVGDRRRKIIPLGTARSSEGPYVQAIQSYSRLLPY
jgi:hypothetical protein